MPERIQQKRTAGWRKPVGAVAVGRPTRWGNPIRVTDDLENGDAATVVAAFTWMVWLNDSAGGDEYPSIDEIRVELAGRDLMCWCPPGHPCHGDVLLEIANS